MAVNSQEGAKKILAAVLFFGACFSFFWQYILKDQVQDYCRTARSWEEMAEARKGAYTDAANAAQREEIFLERVQREVAALEQRLVIDTHPPAQILSLLEEKARETGVEVVSCTFSAPQRGHSYARVPVCVGLKGEYPAVIDFVAGLEKGPRAVIFRSLKIEEEGVKLGAGDRLGAATAQQLPAGRVSPAGSAAGVKEAAAPSQRTYRARLELEFCAFL